jgi:NADP-dependent 3-hydroxy acid dehydrogenase YdfG
MEGKVIAVSGAASGIGLATSLILGSKGAILSLADNREQPLEAAVKSLTSKGYNVIATVVDVRKRDDVEAWMQATIKAFGQVDGAANLAGVIGASMGKKTIANFDADDEWDLIMGVNCTGV